MTSAETFKRILDIYNDSKQLSEYWSFFKKGPPQLTFINDLPIHFDKRAKKLGIAFSGGVDSTLLLYILCKIIKDSNLMTKVYPITMIRFNETKPWLEKISTEVHAYLKNMFPGIIEDQSFGFIPTEFELIKVSNLKSEKYNRMCNAEKTTCDAMLTYEYLEYFSRKHKLDYIYDGTTTNPPTDINNSPQFRELSATGFKLVEAVTSTRISPFRFIFKDWVIAQYHNFGIEELFNITRSCQVDMVDLKMEKWSDGDPYPGECGNCFFCVEKKWGKENMHNHLKVST